MQVNRRSILFTALMMLSETFALSQNCPNEGGFVRTGGDSGEDENGLFLFTMSLSRKAQRCTIHPGTQPLF